MVDTVWGCIKDVKYVQGCNLVCFNRNNNKNIRKTLHVHVIDRLPTNFGNRSL